MSRSAAPDKSRRRTLLRLLIPAALIAGCTAEVRESDLIRPVRGGALIGEAVARSAPAYRLAEQRIRAPDGASLHAVHLGQPGARATILYFGGNGYTIGRHGAWTADLFAPLGVDLIIVGAKDGTTLPSLSKGLYAASPLPEGRKTLRVVAGAGHSDVMTRPGAIAAYRAFLQRVE